MMRLPKTPLLVCALAVLVGGADCRPRDDKPEPPPDLPAPADGGVVVDAGSSAEACADLVMPARLGVVDAVVDDAMAARLLAHRRARHEERMRIEAAPEWAAARLRLEQRHITNGCTDLDGIVDVGRELFTRTVTRADGFGHAATDPKAPLRRVQKGHFGGPDATSCVNCHWKGGDGGAGDRADNSYLLGDGDDVTSADVRNPPVLFGAGWVERAAQELSAELAQQRETLVERVRSTGAASSVGLQAQGIPFGTLRAAPGDNGAVDLDTSGVLGVDADLVIKPFGYKGTAPTLRAFIGRSLQLHLGLQAEEFVEAQRRNAPELVGGNGDIGVGVDLSDGRAGGPADDPDGDGVTREVTAGQLTALVLYIATLDAPRHSPVELSPLGPYQQFTHDLEFTRSPEYTARFAHGYELFERMGCTGCHVPFVRVRDPRYRTTTAFGETVTLDLATDGAQPLPIQDETGAYLIPVFSDFKRHDLGERLAGRHDEHNVPASVWLTRRLWALSQSSPYTHFGNAMVVDEAIAMHGGEADGAARAFDALTAEEKVSLRFFLVSLARGPATRIR